MGGRTKSWGCPRILHHSIRKNGGKGKSCSPHAFFTISYTPHTYFQKWGENQEADGANAFSTSLFPKMGGGNSCGCPCILHHLLRSSLLFPKMEGGKSWECPSILHHLLHPSLLFRKIGKGSQQAEPAHAFFTTFNTHHPSFQKWGDGVKRWGYSGILHHLLHTPIQFSQMEGARQKAEGAHAFYTPCPYFRKWGGRAKGWGGPRILHHSIRKNGERGQKLWCPYIFHHPLHSPLLFPKMGGSWGCPHILYQSISKNGRVQKLRCHAFSNTVFPKMGGCKSWGCRRILQQSISRNGRGQKLRVPMHSSPSPSLLSPISKNGKGGQKAEAAHAFFTTFNTPHPYFQKWWGRGKKLRVLRHSPPSPTHPSPIFKIGGGRAKSWGCPRILYSPLLFPKLGEAGRKAEGAHAFYTPRSYFQNWVSGPRGWGFPRILHYSIRKNGGGGQKLWCSGILQHLLHSPLLFRKMEVGSWGCPRILYQSISKNGKVQKLRYHAFSNTLFPKMGGAKAEGATHSPPVYFQKWEGAKAEGAHAFYTPRSYLQKWGGGQKAEGTQAFFTTLFAKIRGGGAKAVVSMRSSTFPTLFTPISKNRVGEAEAARAFSISLFPKMGVAKSWGCSRIFHHFISKNGKRKSWGCRRIFHHFISKDGKRQKLRVPAHSRPVYFRKWEGAKAEGARAFFIAPISKNGGEWAKAEGATHSLSLDFEKWEWEKLGLPMHFLPSFTLVSAISKNGKGLETVGSKIYWRASGFGPAQESSRPGPGSAWKLFLDPDRDADPLKKYF